MKKFYITFCLIAGIAGYSQEETQKPTSEKATTVSVFYSGPELSQIGVSVEFGDIQNNTNKKYFSANVANLSYGTMDYEVSGFDFTGNGFVAEIGSKTYYCKENKGLYSSNFLSYGNIRFDETVLATKFKGTYSYFSFFSPEVGYKFKTGNLAIDPFVGIMWKLEIKGKGDIDNKNVEEWTPRVGVRIGYQF